MGKKSVEIYPRITAVDQRCSFSLQIPNISFLPLWLIWSKAESSNEVTLMMIFNEAL